MEDSERITYDRLVELFDYNPETGFFIRKTSPNGKQKIGDVLGMNIPNTYSRCTIDNKNYRIHRLVFLYMNKEWPPNELDVDHINGEKNDNRWCNLRLVTPQQNTANSKLSKWNTSGFKGVNFNSTSKWSAYITKDGVRIHIGVFNTPEEAAEAYNKKATELFGEYARLNEIPNNYEKYKVKMVQEVEFEIGASSYKEACVRIEDYRETYGFYKLRRMLKYQDSGFTIKRENNYE